MSVSGFVSLGGDSEAGLKAGQMTGKATECTNKVKETEQGFMVGKSELSVIGGAQVCQGGRRDVLDAHVD